MTQTPLDWTQSPEAKLLISSILARYHKTRMAHTDLHAWILSDPLVQSALTALVPAEPGPGDIVGYAAAFYQMAELLEIPARFASPCDVWESEMLPRIKQALQRLDPSSTPAQPDYRAMLAATARYITHDRDCATIARHGGHLCSCGASAAARDAYAAQASES